MTKVSTKQSSKNLDINRTLFKGQDVETAASWLHSTRQIIAVGQSPLKSRNTDCFD
ncbi:transcriptional regulator [Vibrio cyclitrophicus]|uniref:transcriptional regulator n=1 Tax=Vibrio cyclitrophicus TaxID=47951 RepID=UPI0002FEC2B5|nr:transcriptional regulator [Vibrio cyclitrophicus]